MALAAGPNSEPRRRGRPKGSGINDDARLATIRGLLKDQPALTPTAAIRTSGVDDPSAIRRLRDKLGLSAAPSAAREVERTQPLKARQAEPSAKPAPEAKQEIKREPTPLPPDPPADMRKREAELLAAYLEALAKTAPSAKSETAEPTPQRSPEPGPAPQHNPQQQPAPNPFATMPGFGSMPNLMGMMPNMMPSMMSGMMGMPSWPGMPSMPQSMPSPPGMSIPGLPPFLQPFQAKGQPPAPGTSAARQLEAFKLAIEAMTAIARLQLHLIEQAPAYSPFALMLQGQTFIGQMMIAGLTGQMNALNRAPPQTQG
jgi:hypothetical protein